MHLAKNFHRIFVNQSRIWTRPLSTSAATDKRKKGLPKKLPIAGVKQVLLVSSAKGGVGKSLITVNLAYAIKCLDQNKKVGILDADIYGPSLPTMIGLREKPTTNKLKCMSMGFLIDEEKPIVWRGLMVMSAMEKLLRSVYWGELDVLLVDMPPGTGDTQLSIIQNIPIDGVIIVTTPQKVCLADVVRGTKMFQDLNVPIYGFVKNMSHFVCGKCSHHEPIFDTNDELECLAKKFNTEILVNIPLDRNLSKSADNGCPLVIENINNPNAQIFIQLAEKILSKLENH
ncbi:iron-sulfur protein NUBPL-like protein [Euroglyphus maynei]|uniref:Iron-sulfur protein NUBPL-like protein n=1 Tax=Euroglyphus maynei TaxID=6958 RepID=A0A1Y3BGA8_EURMA|nr:iron-sulfur protein NUBPL-like protein [Euroglyphus maynei]